MSDNTLIEWADATVNAVNGCSVLSPGCKRCYAMRLAGTRMKTHPSRAGLTMPTKAGPVWTGEVRLSESALMQPLKWKRPRRIFWNAHGDLFHDTVPDEWIDRVFAVCALTPQHTHMILTKRPARMREYFSGHASLRIWNRTQDFNVANRGDKLLGDERANFLPLPNVWLGTSVEDQARADERIPDLLATRSAVRFISAEPLLGPVDIGALPWEKSCDCEGYSPTFDALNGTIYCEGCCEGAERVDSQIDWVIVGGESGPGARPMHPDWARSLRDQCQAAGVAFHFKQWGEFEPYDRESHDFSDHDPTMAGVHVGGSEISDIMIRVGKKAAGRLLDGREWNEVPGCAGAPA